MIVVAGATGALNGATVEHLLGFFRAARRGDFAAADPTLGELLGREPRTVRDLLADRVTAR